MPPAKKPEVVATKGLAPHWQTPGRETVKLYLGDALEVLRALPTASVQCCVTSPPYYGLRNYATAEWEGGDDGCDHVLDTEHQKQGATSLRAGRSNVEEQRCENFRDVCGRCGARRVDRQIGMENSTEAYVANLVAVFREVRRVLRDDGVLWLNLGDSFSSGGRADYGPGTNKGQPKDGRRPPATLPQGNLLGIPWRTAFALQDDGWVLRSGLPWCSRNKMPESVQNRPCKSLEFVFLLTKESGCFFDMEAVRRPHTRDWWNESVGAKFCADRNDGGKRQGNNASMNGRSFRDSDLWFASIREPHGVVGISDEWVGLDVTSEPLDKMLLEGRHFACVDDQTEALTKTGWKKHVELSDGYEIAGYDRTSDVLSWQQATFNRYDYDGAVVHLDKRDTSQVLTPEHRCLILSGKKFVRVKRADKVNGHDSLLITAAFEDESEMSIGEDMAALAGWYLSEGHESRGDLFISQSITANPKNVEEITNLLKKMGAKFRFNTRVRSDYDGSPRKEASFKITGKVRHVLSDLCWKKRISDPMTRLPKNELAALLRAFVAGDGHTRSDGRQGVPQKDKHRIEQLQIIAIKLGYRAHLSKKGEDIYQLHLTSGRWLRVCGTGGKWSGPPMMQYKGIVWCPTVPSGYWLARRNGKPFITGNCFPSKLVEPLILAGTSKKGACARCGAPWRRVTERVGGPRTLGWEPSCSCGAEAVPCVVLDPFAGTCTTGAVAVRHGRRFVGIDLSAEYLDMGVRRIVNAEGGGMLKDLKRQMRARKV